MGAAIADRYAGRPLTLLGVLRGSAFFLADLARAIAIPDELDAFLAEQRTCRVATTG